MAESAPPSARRQQLSVLGKRSGGSASGGARRGDIVTIALVPAGMRGVPRPSPADLDPLSIL